MLRELRRNGAKIALAALMIAIAFVAAFSQPLQEDQDGASGRLLYLLAADLEQEYATSEAVVIYRVSREHQLTEEVKVLEARNRLGNFDTTPVGVFSIHETGFYLLVEYPRLYPRSVVIVPVDQPKDFETIEFDPEGFMADTITRGQMEGPGGLVCDLWLLTSVSPVVDEKGYVSVGKKMLRSACKQPGIRAFLKTDDWDGYRSLRFDGDMRHGEVSLLTSQGGKLVENSIGGPDIVLGEMPPGFGSKPRSGPRINPKDCFTDFGSSACPDGRGVTLEAANGRYLVTAMNNEKGLDDNTNVFVQTVRDGKWKRLSVPSVVPTDHDGLRYRLFGDWLVTSLSSLLTPSVPYTNAPIPEYLTLALEGTKSALPATSVEPMPAPNAQSPPTRTLTLYNLADGRRIAIAIPEDDSEIVHVFDGHTVLLRIKDALFFAEIQGSKLVNYKLVAHDSAIPHVHWAFFSSAK